MASSSKAAPSRRPSWRAIPARSPRKGTTSARSFSPTCRRTRRWRRRSSSAPCSARDLDDALRLANGVAYGLTGGFYGRDPADIARVRRELRVGNVYVNRKITGALVGRQPFGGVKLSGIGSKVGGPDYLLQFMQPKTFTENTVRRGFAPPPA